MATRLEHADPLELPSIHDAVRERRPWSRLATIALAGVIVAVALAVLALVAADDLSTGRVLAALLVGAWAAGALFVATHRPLEGLGVLMAAAALAGAVALFGDALLAPGHAADARDWGACSARSASPRCPVSACTSHWRSPTASSVPGRAGSRPGSGTWRRSVWPRTSSIAGPRSR